MPRRNTEPPTASASTASAAASADSIALRAFAILEHVARARVSQTLDDITQAMGLPKPTVFRILNMLHGTGLLLKEQATKRYSAGPRLTAFAIDLWHNRSLREPWRRALEFAVANTGESCNLTMLENSSVLYLDRVETTQPLRLNLESGSRVPLHCTASGKLFLSQMPTHKAKALLGLEPYARYTPTTVTTFALLEPELDAVRRSLVATHDSEYFADSVAIAVPIMNAEGRVFAAVACHAPSSRMNLEKMLTDCVQSLRKAATMIGGSLVSPDSATPLAAAGDAGRPVLADAAAGLPPAVSPVGNHAAPARPRTLRRTA